MTKSKLALFQIDDPHLLNIDTDTSIILIKALIKKGLEVRCYHPNSLSYSNNNITAETYKIDFSYPGKLQKKELGKTELALASYVFIRQDPPFDMNYLTSCYILSLLPKNVKVLNPANILTLYPEKFLPLYFPSHIPDALVTSSLQEVKVFVKEHKEVVIKPLYGHGGRGVFYINYESINNLDTIVEVTKELNNNGSFIVQKYINDVVQGDIRVIMSYDKIIAAIKRTPELKSIRANMAKGGIASKVVLSSKQLEVCKEVGAFLKEKNIFLAGIDLISDYLIEINITSPTGLATANKIYNKNFEDIIIENIL